MALPQHHALRLRQLCAAKEIIKAPGIYDGLSARLVQHAGFSAAFVSGACVAFARFGKPDLGLVSASEMADTVAIIREACDLPLIVDIDTGFGNALNVIRSVQTFERNGASALQMEDQVTPKRCGHMTGKQVIATAEMVGKIRAACDARRNTDTQIFARTDAIAVEGFDAALDRAEAYLAAGADALFIEAPQRLEHMQQISERFGSRVPLIHNLVEGGKSPVTGSTALSELNYKIALYPAALLHGFVPMAQSLLAHIHQQGETTQWPNPMIDLAAINSLLGTDGWLATGKKYSE